MITRTILHGILAVVGGGVGFALAQVQLAGATPPPPHDAGQEEREVKRMGRIVAREIVLVDDDGIARMVIGPIGPLAGGKEKDPSWGIGIFDKDGTDQLHLIASKKGSEFRMVAGDAEANMAINEDRGHFNLQLSKDQRISGLVEDGSAIWWINNANAASTDVSMGNWGFVIRDEKHKLVWRAPAKPSRKVVPPENSIGWNSGQDGG